MSVVTVSVGNDVFGDSRSMDWNKKSEAFALGVSRAETCYHPYRGSDGGGGGTSMSSLERRISASSLSSHGSGGGGKLRSSFSRSSFSRRNKVGMTNSMTLPHSFGLKRILTHNSVGSDLAGELRLGPTRNKGKGSSREFHLRSKWSSTPVIRGQRSRGEQHKSPFLSTESNKNADWGEILLTEPPPALLEEEATKNKNPFVEALGSAKKNKNPLALEAMAKKNPFTEAMTSKMIRPAGASRKDPPPPTQLATQKANNVNVAAPKNLLSELMELDLTFASEAVHNGAALPRLALSSSSMFPLAVRNNNNGFGGATAPPTSSVSIFPSNVGPVFPSIVGSVFPPKVSPVLTTEVGPLPSKVVTSAATKSEESIADDDDISLSKSVDELSLAKSDDISKTTSTDDNDSDNAAPGAKSRWDECLLLPTTTLLMDSCPPWIASLHSGVASVSNAIKTKTSSLLSPPHPEVVPMKVDMPKKVSFSIVEDVIAYEVTPEDIKKSWSVLKVPTTLKNIEMISRHRGIAVSYSDAAQIPGKTCMVHIEPKPLIAEILMMTDRHRQAVFLEQDRQRREGGMMDEEKMGEVARKYSRWGVELATSNWWLER